jgi:hypothetical protein
MARHKANVPSRVYHLSGQSVCRIDGKDYYLGKHDSPESLARYAVLIAEYQKHGLKLPEGFSADDLKNRADVLLGFDAPQHQEQEPITVKHVTACYRAFGEVRYAKSSQERHRIRKLAGDLDAQFGDVLAENFGPLKLQQFRQTLVDSGLSRNYVNRVVRAVVRMFKHAVQQELIEPETWQKLTSVESLRLGQTEAYEPDKVKPVSIDVVRATSQHLASSKKCGAVSSASQLKSCQFTAIDGQLMLEQRIDQSAARSLEADFDVTAREPLSPLIDPVSDGLRILLKHPGADFAVGCNAMKRVIFISPIDADQECQTADRIGFSGLSRFANLVA